MKYIAIILLLSCSTWKPNASLTGRVVEVKTIGKSRFEVKLVTPDTVTAYMVRMQRPRIGQMYKILYDTTCKDQGRKAIIKRKK